MHFDVHVCNKNIYHTECTLLVIWILDRVHGLIFPVKVYILPSTAERLM
jgi:hypothetical protein